MVILKVKESEFGPDIKQNYDEAIKYFDSRVNFLNQKMDALLENKDLLLQDKQVYEKKF